MNGDFSGSDGWLMAGVPIGKSARIVTGSYYHSASRYAVLGEYDSSDEGLWQDFLVPANATTVSLSYWLYINSLENNNQEYDKFDVTIRTVPNGNLIAQLDHKSNLDHSNTSPSDPVAHYVLRTFDLSSYLSGYKGQYVRLHFHCSTDPAIFTSFKVDDVSVQATVPIAPTPVLFSVSGYTSVAEGNTAQYDATVDYSDGSVASVTPSWSVSGPATITSSGLLSAGNVNSDTAATVTANYSGFPPLHFPITIINVAPVFSSLAISGPSSINENSSGQFTATAVFSDGSTVSASPSWSINSGPGSVSSSGLLTVGEVSGDSTTTVSASATIGGVMRSASQQVSVINVPPPATLSSLSISGPSSLNDNSTAQYTATAFFSDGSSLPVSPTWLENSSVTSISIFGLLSAGWVTANTPVTVSASYTIGGVTAPATKAVTVIRTDTTVPTVTISSPTNGQSFSTSPITVSGTASDPGSPSSGLASVTINTGAANEGTLANWQFTVNLTPGQNALVVSATDQAGNMGSAQIIATLVPYVIAWGDNRRSQTNVPAGMIGVLAIAAGEYHSLALKRDRAITAWGENNFGQCSASPERTNVIAIAGGGAHSLALKADGSVMAWGYNSFGQTNVPAGLVNAVAIAAGDLHSLALKADGTLTAWGYNGDGETNVPSGLTNVVAIAGCNLHNLALRADGTVVAWGWNSYGQTNVPAGLANVVAIAAGGIHCMALKADGTVAAWGAGKTDNPSSGSDYGQSLVPIGLTNVVAIAAGWYHSLALKMDGTVVAWGLGKTNNGVNGGEWGQSIVPIGLTNVVAIAAGAYHSLALVGAGAPVLTVQPFSRTFTEGEGMVLTVMAVGSQPLSYQWRKDGVNVTGATSASLTLSNVQTNQAGNYAVVITNAYGSVTSSVAVVSVNVNLLKGYVSFDDMENGQGDWATQAPWSLTTESSHSANHSWTDSPGGNYANGTNVSLSSPLIDLTGQTTATLTFWHQFDFAAGDSGNIWILPDGGSFTKLRSFFGTDLNWHQETINLSTYTGQKVRIYFQLFSDSSGVADGWHVDDVGVNVLPQSTITWATPADIVYGTALASAQLNATATASGTNVAGTFVYSPALGTVLGAGNAQTLSVTFTPTDTTHYLPATATVSINVLKAPLAVTANGANRSYGVANPGFSATSSGFVNGDTAAVVSGTPNFTTTTTASSPVGNYDIVPALGTLSAANYQFTSFINGTLTVSPAALTITANNQSKVYGQAVPFAGTEFTPAGLLNGDTVTSVALTSAGAATTATVTGSPYSIVPSSATGTGLGNYAVSYQPGTLTVGPAALTITANNRSKAYGEAVAFAGTEFTTSALPNSETVGSVAVTSSGAVATAGLSGSPFSIVPSAATGGTFNPANYTISYQNGVLAVSPAALTVTANNRSKTYGQVVSFTGTEFTPSGLQNSETVGLVTLSSSGAAAAAGVSGSPYGIVPSAAAGGTFNSANYTISYHDGALMVNPAALTVTANDTNRVYGAANPAFTGTMTGLQNNDNITASFTCSAGASSPVGIYDIVPSLLDPSGKLGNYAVTANNGRLTIVAIPRIISGGLVDHTFSLSVPTAVGLNYVLEYKTSLVDTAWIAAQMLLGTGGPIAFSDNTATNQTRFYRIRVE